MDRGYIDFWRLHQLHQAGSFFVTRQAQAKQGCATSRFARHGPIHRCDLRSDARAAGTSVRQGLSRDISRYTLQGSETGKRPLFISNNAILPALSICTFVKGQMAGGAHLSLDQNALARKGILRDRGERSQSADLDRGGGLRVGRHHQKAPQSLSQPVRNATDFEPQPVGENPTGYKHFRAFRRPQKQLGTASS